MSNRTVLDRVRSFAAALATGGRGHYECGACGASYAVQHHVCPECGSFTVEDGRW
ncbi:MAG: 50S ribosomal protein L32 [Halobacteriaceae archaeon]